MLRVEYLGLSVECLGLMCVEGPGTTSRRSTQAPPRSRPPEEPRAPLDGRKWTGRWTRKHRSMDAQVVKMITVRWTHTHRSMDALQPFTERGRAVARRDAAEKGFHL